MRALFLIVFLCALARCTLATNCTLSDQDKIDCGFVGITQASCQLKGCCWNPSTPGSSTPWCFYPASAPAPPPSGGGAVFNDSEVALMTKYFLANINIDGSGGVVASPDPTTPGGSYYYNWARDAALTMNTVHLIMGNTTQGVALLKSYVQWVLRVTVQNDPNGVDIRIEPKFNLPSGTPYTGGWCRPQTDAPGLRARVLSNFAMTLMANGQTGYVKQYLWTGSQSNYNGGAIKHNLDWIVSNWQQKGCDLWEEVTSNDFFWNRFTMKHGLLLGAEVAETLGDTGSATTYRNTAAAINATLPNHFNGQYVYESTNRPQDGATICAFNDGYTGDGLFNPTDGRVAQTVNVLNQVFYNAFPINAQDDRAGVPGILYGRYPGDHYAGGNPWILTTAALGQLFYTGASEVLDMNALPPAEDMKHWRDLLELDVDPESHVDFARMLASKGDGQMARLRYHVAGAGFHLSEQLDKNTGYELSATDLTWSYATVLKAMHFRSVYLARLAEVEAAL